MGSWRLENGLQISESGFSGFWGMWDCTVSTESYGHLGCKALGFFVFLLALFQPQVGW